MRTPRKVVPRLDFDAAATEVALAIIAWGKLMPSSPKKGAALLKIQQAEARLYDMCEELADQLTEVTATKGKR